ncbi:hypothetical protein SAY86_003613 [Trapa natans]|uniref:RING-type E3 ubiquitin transferase n=1 Tax=Trapa natans TaxID=22666 RepID=A0AAN7N227_TRANT|nr:hypothetical protein SAY86_003613 [Trapa natans]
MAIRSRKLFPALTAASNETIYCPDFCDPGCPYYNCPDDFYFSSPPPSAPLTPTPRPPPSSGGGLFSPSFITSLALLAGFFVLLAYYLVIVKSCFCRGSRSMNNPQPPTSGFLDENRVDHPIWFITTVGLQQSIINTITVCMYREGDGLIEGSECSVCLNDFREGESLRLLPKCSHAFHIRCIDTWLRSHTNCPLCRANVVAPCGAELGTTRPHAIGDAQMEDSSESNDLGGDQMRNSGTENMAVADEAEESQREDLQIQEELKLEKGSDSPSSSSSSSSSERQIHLEADRSPEQEDVRANNTLLKSAASADSA